MRKIKSVEDALILFELSTIIHDESMQSGEYRKNNKAYHDRKKVIKYLLENNSIEKLKIFYKSSNLFTKLIAATWLAPIDNEVCYRIVKEIMDMHRSGVSLEAEFTLKAWSELSDLKIYDKVLSE